MSRSWAASIIPSIGGNHPVMFDAPVMASSRGGGRCEGGETVVKVKVPSGPHSTNRRRDSRDHGSRLAWCSTTVVTTTSSGRGAAGRRGG